MGLACLVVLGTQMLAVPHIQQINVMQQTGSSCGYHAVYNAQAVETLALQGRQLVAAAVVGQARQYREFIQKDALLGDTIIDLASQLGIGNLYCINGRNNGLSFAGSSQGAQDGDLFLQDIATQREYGYPKVGHFVVNTGGHWVVFSVIKHVGQQPIVLYMDSLNTPLSRNRTAQAVGNALLARLGIAGRVDVGRAPGRPDRNAGRGYRKPDKRGTYPKYTQEDTEQDSYGQDSAQDTQIQKAPKSDGFSYKTYIAVGLVCLLIGFNLKK